MRTSEVLVNSSKILSVKKFTKTSTGIDFQQQYQINHLVHLYIFEDKELHLFDEKHQSIPAADKTIQDLLNLLILFDWYTVNHF